MLWSLAIAGLPAPPLLDVVGPDVRRHEGWQWGTHPFDPRAFYLMNLPLIHELAGRPGPQLMLCHAGHGSNSYALSLFVSAGPLAAFVQHGWGGVYMDPLKARESAARSYVRLHTLYESLPRDAGPAQWLLLWSDLRSTATVQALLPGEPTEATHFSGPSAHSAVFDAVSDRLGVRETGRLRDSGR